MAHLTGRLSRARWLMACAAVTVVAAGLTASDAVASSGGDWPPWHVGYEVAVTMTGSSYDATWSPDGSIVVTHTPSRGCGVVSASASFDPRLLCAADLGADFSPTLSQTVVGIPCDPTRESTVVTLLGSHEQFAEHIVDLDSADAAAKRVTAFTKQLGDCTPYGPEGLTFEVLSTTPMKGADAGVVYRVTYPPYGADVVANESVGRSVISMSVVVSGDDLSDLSAPRRDFALALDRMRHPKPASPTDISKPLPPEPSPPAWPQSAGLWP